MDSAPPLQADHATGAGSHSNPTADVRDAPRAEPPGTLHGHGVAPEANRATSILTARVSVISGAFSTTSPSAGSRFHIPANINELDRLAAEEFYHDQFGAV